MKNDKGLYVHINPSADSEKVEELLKKTALKSEEMQYLTDNLKLFDTEEEYLQNLYLDTDELKKEITQHVSSSLKAFKLSQILLLFIVVIEPIYIFMLLRFLGV